ncbi:MAG: DNA polymerase III subunit gamma/tau [Rhodospirillaceae bacterium]|nr:DNA polymerase III subunit gamma/tau [Rhodospirillaceae bacterium]
MTDTASDPAAATGTSAANYRVLARKYRPARFTDLIGQEAVVRTLTNAITSGRIAQGYMLTGVRGVGKTTTARLIARALNCIGPDGNGGATPDPCGVCVHCTGIAEDRHVDVLEMDAASRTGIDDIRELLDGVRYRPTSARYKVYIVDEVHMLSEKAFNALLKTLEEPPAHVKFIFATTEIRKVPVTVLSRCQRFDLRRIESDDLIRLFSDVAKREAAKVEPGAMALIARAADGSARDGLSILDQAISQAAGAGDQTVTEQAVRDMLGLADRARVFDLFDAVMTGDAKSALGMLHDQYAAGANPVVVVQDLLELVHWLTRVKISPETARDPGLAETERTRGVTMAKALSVAVLSRSWQMLLKGLSEARSAPLPLQAVEMILIRLAYASDLPTPGDALKTLQSGGVVPAAPKVTPATTPSPAPRAMAVGSSGYSPTPQSRPIAEPVATQTTEAVALKSFADVALLFERKREIKLAALLKRSVRLVRFEDGRIEFNPDKGAPADLAGLVGKHLTQWTGQRWVVSVVNAAGEKTLYEQDEERAKADPLIKSLLEAFPRAKIDRISRAEE